MYVILFLILLIIVTAIAITFLSQEYDEPNFVTAKSQNFSNIEYYNGTYNNTPIKISPQLDWFEYKKKRYFYKYKNSYTASDDHYINLRKNIFYYVDSPVYSQNQISHNHNIPKLIWQIWLGSNDFSPFNTNINTFKSQQGWKHTVFTDDMVEPFLKDNFKEDVLMAFNTLKPGAFKADLLRACLLYIHGGVYADIKLNLHCNLDSFLDRDLVVVREMKNELIKAVWNGFLASTPRNEFFMKVIDGIVENVKNRFYGYTNIAVTGPVLYGKVFTEHYNVSEITEGKTDNYKILNIIDIKNYSKYVINEVPNHEMFITWEKKRSYVKRYKTNSRDYADAWGNRDIYNEL